VRAKTAWEMQVRKNQLDVVLCRADNRRSDEFDEKGCASRKKVTAVNRKCERTRYCGRVKSVSKDSGRCIEEYESWGGVD
jgi:hypothetical protein